MTIALEKPFFIQLDIPTTPLLSSLPPGAESLLIASTPPAPPCLPRLNVLSEMAPFPEMPVSSSSSGSSLHSSHPLPDITITSPLSESPYDEPSNSPAPAASPRPSTRLSTAASRKLVEFIDFLETIDRDMAAEVEHVKESIREAREYIGEWREERSTRGAEFLKKRERERKLTRRRDSDFWIRI
ncbi:hypothetical protein F5148DRAFT_1200931 [Russula earlei]|uniref:Uncharacterized protein n=1 Tax=Russula earlei TaxID=71964 RepID=A0ACC0U8N1_9AGAM|nr:hypothetical protein F5148DRAFT_1200931 [Russula earlei]